MIAAWTVAAAALVYADMSAVTLDEAEDILIDAGLALTGRADEDSENYAYESLAGTTGDYSYFVRLMDCDDARTWCSTVMFASNFQLGRAAEKSDYANVARFNDIHRFGRGYVYDSGEESLVGVDFVLSLEGGVSDDYLAVQTLKWEGIVEDFVGVFLESE